MTLITGKDELNHLAGNWWNLLS